MRLLVIRHAEAEDREEFARRNPDDGLRPLTARGRKRMERAARGLRKVVKEIDRLGSSPLKRAVETAEIVAEVYGARVNERAELAPTARPGALLKWLQQQPAKSTVAIVGHEPHLGVVASWLLSGLDESFIHLKKGSAVMIDFPERVAAGHGKLQWMMTCGQMRKRGG